MSTNSQVRRLSSSVGVNATANANPNSNASHPMPTFRKAIESDVPDLAILAEKIFRTIPTQQIRYPGCTAEEYKRYFRELFLRYLAQRSAKVYVSLLPASDGSAREVIVGFLVWTEHGFGHKQKKELPEVRLPDCTDLEVLPLCTAYMDNFSSRILGEDTPYICGEYLGVDMNARLVGVASGLSRIMAAAVKKARKPVFFCVAIQAALHFYERFAVVHAYEIHEVGEPLYLDKEQTVAIKTYRMVKREKREDKPIPFYRKGSPE